MGTKRDKTTEARQGSDDIRPVYVVAGKEDVLKRDAIEQIIPRLLPPKQQGMGLSRYEGNSAGLADVLDELRTLPFLAERRVVIVDDADKFISQNRKDLEVYVDAPSPTGVLVMVCKSFPSNTKLHGAVGKIGRVIKCDPPKRGGLAEWVSKRSRNRHGKQLPKSAAELLIDLVGGDVGTLAAEIHKLVLYVGERDRITPEDVEVLVGERREETVFGILAAMAERRTDKAFTLWERTWQTDRGAPGKAIGGLAWGVRRLIDAKRQHQRGAPLGVIARILWADPQTVRRRLDAYDMTTLQRQLRFLSRADVMTKSGLGSVQSLIERFIVEFSAHRGAARSGRVVARAM